jgi:hypothetical protein
MSLPASVKVADIAVEAREATAPEALRRGGP